MKIESDDAPYLIASIKRGDAMLVLGAGASVSSTNAQGEPVKTGWGLAKALCEKASLPYSGETLQEVLGAIRGTILSDIAIREILVREYKNCRPSDELAALFAYSWKRIYTWNIDDNIENINRRTSQTRSYFNGLIDKAVEFDGSNKLHVVQLHGQIIKPEHNFIFTEQDYNTWIKSERHFWYKRAAQDYLSTCPIFIGSQLAEPILAAELERAKRQEQSVAGRAYLIVPDDLSPVRRANLRAKGIVHIQGTLEDFSLWLQTELKGGWSPKEILTSTQNVAERSISGLTPDEVASVSYLHEKDPKAIRTQFGMLRGPEKTRHARQFLQGFPPTWGISSSDIPVFLENTRELYQQFSNSYSRSEKLFIVSGQAGSGKTTAAMQCCLQFAEKNNVSLFELDPNTKSISNSFRLLKRVRSQKVIVYIGDLFVYGDNFRLDLERLSGEDFFIVSTVRPGEWNEHLARYLGKAVKPFLFQRFSRNDFDPLIDRLTAFVPAPTFRKLSLKEKRIKLDSSKSQLLIALREATKSENFNAIITSEFEGLPDIDTKQLFLIIGLATIARVGITVATAKEAYDSISHGRTFDQALKVLEGIVGEGDHQRLYARHDLYVEHVLETVANFSEISASITAILRTFVKFNVPVIRSVNRLDSVLFRSLMNHNFIQVHARRHSSVFDGLKIYEEFEVDFQLDGHYWLQYGLYLAGIPRLTDAAKMLGRSIDAYPDNMFAVHALADIELRIARARSVFDQGTRQLINKAVATLLAQEAKAHIEMDRYPIVTLATGHIGVLIKHHQVDEAKRNARSYFEKIKTAEKNGLNDAGMTLAKERLFRFITLNEWQSVSVEQRETPFARKRRRNRRVISRTAAP